MNISEDIRPVTYLKSRAADLLKQINETHRPVIITQNGGLFQGMDVRTVFPSYPALLLPDGAGTKK